MRNTCPKSRGPPLEPENGIPEFLHKLHSILEDPRCTEAIGWTQEGTHVLVKDVSRFSDKILPVYFRHKNFASFMRQLNIYGFHKVRGKRNCYFHPCFRRHQTELVRGMKRRIACEGDEQQIPAKKKAGLEDVMEELGKLGQRMQKAEEKCMEYEKVIEEMSTRGKITDKLVSLLAEKLLSEKEKATFGVSESPQPPLLMGDSLPDGLRANSVTSTLENPSMCEETKGQEETKQQKRGKRFQIQLHYDDTDMAVARFSSHRPVPAKNCEVSTPGSFYALRQLRAQDSNKRVLRTGTTPRSRRPVAILVDGVVEKTEEGHGDCGQKEC